MTARVFLNGEWLAADQARVSVMDRGFLFGDGVYEVIPVYSRRPFRLEQHLARLQKSLNGIQLANPHRPEQWIALVTQLAGEADWEDQSIYIQVTRGPMAVRNHAFPTEIKPTVLLLAEPMSPPPATQREQGIGAVSAADIRWLRCDLKTTSLLANCLLRQLAVSAGCVETVLFRDGFLTEGSASSIFVVKHGVLLAPIKNHLMLPGITYDVVLELAVQHGLPHEVRDITEAETRDANELWMCSSTKEVLPIVTLDGRAVGSGVGASGTPGPVFAKMYAWYQEFKATVMRTPA
ncbi:MAG: D-amino acid aminotransferase [Sulfuritalea sp.]|jgi:D-alanine transaminase|nr:D-amino acid aminotransferase [Sulfuritalea sp.]